MRRLPLPAILRHTKKAKTEKDKKVNISATKY